MIIYFTGTGNSRYVARELSRLTEMPLVSLNDRIKRDDKTPLSSADPLVFVFPVYAGRMPKVMEQYLRELSFTGCSTAYFVATCAATPWQSEKYLRRFAGDKSFAWAGFSSVLMPQGYIAGGGTRPKEENDKVIAAARPKIEAIAASIRKGEPLAAEKPGSWVMSGLLNPIMYAAMINAKAFYATDTCTGCGECVEHCPLNNVRLEQNRPVWGSTCTHCMACIAGCEAGAIEYGKKTVGLPRHYLK